MLPATAPSQAMNAAWNSHMGQTPPKAPSAQDACKLEATQAQGHNSGFPSLVQLPVLCQGGGLDNGQASSQ